MVCVDEVHLMVQFGLHFRAEFLRLKTLLFLSFLAIAPSSANNADAVNKPNSANRLPTLTTFPILFMTDHVILQQLERITGYCFDKSNLFWPSAGDMQQRKEQLWYMPTPTMVSSILCPLTKSCFVEGSRKKFIVYGNSSSRVTEADQGVSPATKQLVLNRIQKEKKKVMVNAENIDDD